MRRIAHTFAIVAALLTLAMPAGVRLFAAGTPRILPPALPALALDLVQARVTPRAVSHQTLTISTAAVQFSDAAINPAGTVNVSTVSGRSVSVDAAAGFVEGGDFRFWTDGSTPTSTVGKKVAAGSWIYFDNRADISRFSAIRDSASGADAVLTVEFSR